MKNRGWGVLAVACTLTLAVLAAAAHAVETKVTVRVLAKDAKFVGTGMGGALVTIKDDDTGAILARGVTEGSTGDTKLLMTKPITRRTPLSDDGSASFTASLDIDEPVFVEISARGPLAQRQSTASASVTQWLLPGKDVTQGDAVLLELPGFAVDVLAPPAHVRLGAAPQAVEIKANVTMICGCPVEPGGLWDADAFDIHALVTRDGERVADLAMTYAGQTSQFEATYTAGQAGTYRVTVYAFDPKNGNAGLDQTTFVVR